MPYLPAHNLTAPANPKGDGNDLSNQIRQIEDLYKYRNLHLLYYSLKNKPTVVADMATLSGETGNSKVDPLYREAVDPSRTTWKQAQGTVGSVLAVDPEVYRDPVLLYCLLVQVSTERDLKRQGFDPTKISSVKIPVSFLDAANITAVAGDKLKWAGYIYKVKKVEQTGWWAISSVFLFVTCDVELLRVGA